MNLEKLYSQVSRLFFPGAFLLLALGLVERIANATGYTILRVRNWERLLDIAVALFVFVIAEQLREIKAQLTKGRA